MADNEIEPSMNGSREELVAKQLASTKIHLALTQERADVSGAIKLPLERIPQLGVAFASLPSMFRTVTSRPISLAIRLTRRYSNLSRTAVASWDPTAMRPRVSGRRAST